MFIAMQTETIQKSLLHREQKPFNIGDMAAAYLKHFSTHLGGQWMPPTLVRHKISDGEAYIL